MTRKYNIIAQIAAGAGQVLIPAAPISPEWKSFAHAAIAFVQLTVSILAHNSTPQGDKIQ